MGRRYYAVRRGWQPGVYTTWEQCEQQVSGVADAEYKIFKLKREAQMYLSEEQQLPSRAAVDQVYVLEYDGASKGNPGKAGAGALLRDSNGVVVKELCLALDTATNNVAEYQALILGLRAALKQNISRICVRGDSNLVCKQVAGEWEVKSESLRPLHAEAKRLSEEFAEFSIEHVRREFNSAADTLANRAIIEQADIPDTSASQSASDDRPVKSKTKRSGLAQEPVFLLEYDGASNGNLGKAGAGVLIRDSAGCLIEELSVLLGTATCNVAMYKALILGLKAALAKNITRIKVSGDSNLVCKQVKGDWAVKSDILRPLHAEVLDLSKQFTEFSIHHVGPESNKAADALSHKATADISTLALDSVEKPVVVKGATVETHADKTLYILEYDGASKGNPGKAGAGALIRTSTGKLVEKLCIGLGEATNNVAEYEGLILGLKAAVARNIVRIQASGDSTLVCKQVAGEWAVKNEKLKPLHAAAQALSKKFVEFSILQVAREYNTDADALANRGIALPYRTTSVKPSRKLREHTEHENIRQTRYPRVTTGRSKTGCRMYHRLPDHVPLLRHACLRRSTASIAAVTKLITLFKVS